MPAGSTERVKEQAAGHGIPRGGFELPALEAQIVMCRTRALQRSDPLIGE
jgi:hypothetical protein